MADPKERKAYVAKLVDLLAVSIEADPLGQFVRTRQSVRRPQPRINLPQAPLAQSAPVAPNTRIRLANQSELFVEHEAGAPVARFFAGGAYWHIRPEFAAAFQRMSAAQSASVQDLAATIADKTLIPMFHSTLDAFSGAGLLFKENE